MSEGISYCGLICQGCPIYWATREEDKEKKEKMRAEIARICKEQYGEELKPDDITDCDGCRTEKGKLFSASSKCQIRKCAREKGLENCAYCRKYPCENLKVFFASEPEAKTRLDLINRVL
ncbi:MAG: DUF3795 domain-containing protein [Candidatus Aminicenantes bacterium]